jgi:hypothetical protein
MKSWHSYPGENHDEICDNLRGYTTTSVLTRILSISSLTVDNALPITQRNL